MNALFHARRIQYLRTPDIEEDAKHNLYNCPARIEAILGKPRPFDPVNDPEHGDLAERANSDADIEERKADLEEQDKKCAWYMRRWVLVSGLSIVLVLEAISCIQVFAALGIEMPERAFFGFGLTAVMLVLTFFLVRHARHTKEDIPS